MASTPPAPPPTLAVPIRCSVEGAKLIAPALSADQACARFIAAIRGGSAVNAPPHDGLAVTLRFLPRGIAKASVTRFQGGRAQAEKVFELAVSDRAFNSGDIDRLASDVASGFAIGR